MGTPVFAAAAAAARYTTAQFGGNGLQREIGGGAWHKKSELWAPEAGVDEDIQLKS